MRTASTIAAALLLMAIGTSDVSTQATRTTEQTVVEVTARSARALVGQTIVVAVRVRGARNVGSVPFTLFYDPALLEYVPSSAREGRFLRQRGASTVFLATPSSWFDAIIVGHSRLGSGPGASGRGILCTLRFKVIAPGTSSLSLGRAKVLDPSAASQPAVFVGTEITTRSHR